MLGVVLGAVAEDELERTRLVDILFFPQEALLVAFRGGDGKECELLFVGERRPFAVAAITSFRRRQREWEA